MINALSIYRFDGLESKLIYKTDKVSGRLTNR